MCKVLCKAQCAKHNVQSAMCTEQCAEHNVQSAMYKVLCKAQCAKRKVQSANVQSAINVQCANVQSLREQLKVNERVIANGWQSTGQSQWVRVDGIQPTVYILGMYYFFFLIIVPLLRFFIKHLKLVKIVLIFEKIIL